ncbi:MAG: ribonuclease PH [Clostridiaceae bacterium]|nr:ribonuclease PH [Clostridiaceae bacterium]
MDRIDNRKHDQLREITILRNYTKYAPGSVLIKMGDTIVLCTASYENKVPAFKKDTGEGWLTAEYAMLPSSTQKRNVRDISKLKLSGRSSEIQRLIGRALRSMVDLTKLGENTIIIDCDVLQADGGTRCASIIGAAVALCDCVGQMLKDGVILENPIKSMTAAVSVGKVSGELLLDLCYEEDSNADADINVVMNDNFEFIEIQGTSEKDTFTFDELNSLLNLAKKGLEEIFKIQKAVLSEGIVESENNLRDQQQGENI